MYQDKPKAVIIKTFNVEHLIIKLTEKGAVSLYRRNSNGEEQYMFTVMPRDVEATAILCPPLHDVINSVEWAQVQEGKQKAKTQRYEGHKRAEVQDRADKLFLAMIDQLKQINPAEAQRLLEAKLKAS